MKIKHLAPYDMAYIFPQNITSFLGEFQGQSNWGKFVRTALVFTGVNIADRETVFRHLTSHLRAELTPHVVVLQAQQCNNIGNTIKLLVEKVEELEATTERLGQAERRLATKTQDMESEWPSKVSQCKQEMGDVLDAAVMGLHSHIDQMQGAIPDNLDTTIAGTCKELMEKQYEL
jgi:hypothetical protein